MDNSELLSFMTTPPSLEDVLANGEYKTIREAAEKLQNRLGDINESDGILTTSRSLVETTCKTLLDGLNVEYNEKADLPDISKRLTEALDLHPASNTNQALRQICQGAMSMINGIAHVRNAHSDAHGQGVNATDLPFRHAELSAYMACSLTRYLVESFESKVSRKIFSNLDDSQKKTLIDVWLEIGKKYQMTKPRQTSLQRGTRRNCSTIYPRDGYRSFSKRHLSRPAKSPEITQPSQANVGLIVLLFKAA